MKGRKVVRSPDWDRSHNYKGVYDMILDKVRGSLDRDRSHNYKVVYDMILDKVRVSLDWYRSHNYKGVYDMNSGLWIRIRMDPHSFSLLDPDPDPGG